MSNSELIKYVMASAIFCDFPLFIRLAMRFRMSLFFGIFPLLTFQNVCLFSWKTLMEGIERIELRIKSSLTRIRFGAPAVYLPFFGIEVDAEKDDLFAGCGVLRGVALLFYLRDGFIGAFV